MPDPKLVRLILNQIHNLPLRLYVRLNVALGREGPSGQMWRPPQTIEEIDTMGTDYWNGSRSPRALA